jgi:hypothetical protein
LIFKKGVTVIELVDPNDACAEDTDRIDSGNLMASCLPDYEAVVNIGKCIQEKDQAVVRLASQTG